MKYAVIVNLKFPKFYRFEFEVEEEARIAINMLETAMQGKGKTCLRIQDSIFRADVIESVHLLQPK